MTARRSPPVALAALLRALAVLLVLVVAGAIAVAPAAVDAAPLVDAGSAAEVIEDDDLPMIATAAAPELAGSRAVVTIATPRLARPAHAPATAPPDPPPRP